MTTTAATSVQVRPARWRNAAVLGLFATAIFLGSLLVFLVQPMIARMILPRFGGAPAVWNTSLVFFQVLLLLGYGWAHFSLRRFSALRQPLVQIGVMLLPLAFLPFRLPGTDAFGGAPPALQVLAVLAVAVGVPYLVVTTGSPLLQRWFSRVDHPAAADPYFLYAAGNVGSLAALLAYPSIVEPALELRAQTTLWAWLYVAFALVVAACALTVRASVARGGAATSLPDLPPPPAAQEDSAPFGDTAGAHGSGLQVDLTRTQVILLASIPSALMVGVTTFATTDLAPIPFLWVVPLAFYLLTFVIAFANISILGPRVAALGMIAMPLGLVIDAAPAVDLPLWLLLALHLGLLFFGALLAHGLLAAGRPHVDKLTGFYLDISIGGVLGGAFAALVAPVAFNDVWEYPLAIAGALLLCQLVRKRPRAPLLGRATVAWAVVLGVVAQLLHMAVLRGTPFGLRPSVWDLIVTALMVLVLLAAIRRPLVLAVVAAVLLQPVGLRSAVDVFHQDRTFFGVVRVAESQDPKMHRLYHGTTMHGAQLQGRDAMQPTSYYGRGGPVGDIFRHLQDPEFDRVGVIGLGAGGIAAYGKPGQEFVFWEIDQAVIDVARDEESFTFLSDSRAKVTTVEQDGRLGIEASRTDSFDLVMIDAFSSDAVPVHLLTKEALELYLDRVGRDGLVAFHISARHVDLQPVVLAAAKAVGAGVVVNTDDEITDERIKRGELQSLWMIVSRDRARLREAEQLVPQRWFEPFTLDSQTSARVWTDDYASVLSVVDWGGLPYRQSY